MWLSPLKRRLLVGVLACVGLAAVAAVASQRAASHAQLRAPVVRISTVENIEATRRSTFTGSLRPGRQAELAFTVTGRVIERPVELGDRVLKGDVLAQLDPDPLENGVNVAKAERARLAAQLRQGKRNRKRAKRLFSADALSEVAAEEASSGVSVLSAALAAASAHVDEAERMLKEGTLTAPFDGVITALDVEEGEFAVAGRPVVVLGSDDRLELEVELPEELVGYLENGQTVEIALPRHEGISITGRVSAVGHAMPERGRLFPVVVSIEASEGLLPGMSAELKLAVEGKSSLAVPVEAVVNPGSAHPSVFRVVDGTVERVPIRVREVWRDRALVTGEIEEGDAVVTHGHSGLTPGLAVEVVR